MIVWVDHIVVSIHQRRIVLNLYWNNGEEKKISSRRLV